ncbi:MAG: class I SAM-dependent methyltransferase [Planctomyces sp.]|nr:class I SAM-dependent methyltransferase [Planctomyces sp.]
MGDSQRPSISHHKTHHVRTEYNRLAATYDQRWSHYVESTITATLDGLELVGDERVLDIPIGTGELALRLLQRWQQLKIAGVDLSPRMLDQAAAKFRSSETSRSHWGGSHSGVVGSNHHPSNPNHSLSGNPQSDLTVPDLYEGCVTSLPFADHEFDCIFCVNSFHYFPDPEKSLMELRRVLRDGGKLILVDWCDDYWMCRMCSLWLRLVDPAFHQTYSQRHCEALLREAGFRIDHARRFRVGRIWGLMRIEARAAGNL